MIVVLMACCETSCTSSFNCMLSVQKANVVKQTKYVMLNYIIKNVLVLNLHIFDDRLTVYLWKMSNIS